MIELVRNKIECWPLLRGVVAHAAWHCCVALLRGLCCVAVLQFVLWVLLRCCMVALIFGLGLLCGVGFLWARLRGAFAHKCIFKFVISCWLILHFNFSTQDEI